MVGNYFFGLFSAGQQHSPGCLARQNSLRQVGTRWLIFSFIPANYQNFPENKCRKSVCRRHTVHRTRHPN